MSKIPQHVQILQKLDPDDDIKNNLISVYKSGGVLIDSDMKMKNPNAKQTIPFVSVTSEFISNTKSKFFGTGESAGNWVYCGEGWYVRNNEGIYEFSKYMAYNTVNKRVEDIWDARKHNI